jgi:hypothetical protein
MENLFPWNSLPQDYKEHLALLPIKGATPIKKV